MAEKQKVSEWLDDFEGHDICHAGVLADLEEKTGYRSPVGPQPRQQFLDELAAEGRGGWLNGEGPFVGMLSVAESAAADLADAHPTAMGRGFRFRQCVELLRQAGK